MPGNAGLITDGRGQHRLTGAAVAVSRNLNRLAVARAAKARPDGRFMILCNHDHDQASGVGGYFSQGPETPEKIFDVAFVKGPGARGTRVF